MDMNFSSFWNATKIKLVIGNKRSKHPHFQINGRLSHVWDRQNKKKQSSSFAEAIADVLLVAPTHVFNNFFVFEALQCSW